jgi:nitrate/TMAO reductase-like tetraheme cytochrome c subunit
MAKISFAGWKDPVRRPRYIIWSGVAVLVLAAVMIVALGATSTYWFCANGCHKVQDDTITAYNASSHNKVSCMACHMPVAANPVVFILHKAEALGELYMTVTNKFELPLNAESQLSLEMKATQCTQCHSENRITSPSEGIIIDHKVHEEREVSCPVCHNRVAHRDDIAAPVLNDPTTGEKNYPHDQFMTMNGCFRCHSQEARGIAPGECKLCHTPTFELKPPSHEPTATWFPKGHAEAALEENKEVLEAKAEEASAALSGEAEQQKKEAAQTSGDTAAESKEDLKGEILIEKMTPFKQVNECLTCHNEKTFCEGCHGMPMPHPAEFKEPKTPTDPQGHPVISKQLPKKCEMCHQPEKTQFCNKCHHGTYINFDYKVAVPWVNQHPAAVAKGGIAPCTDKCHTKKFCADCHTGRKVIPASHKQRFWTRPIVPTVTVYGKSAAKPSAKHAVAAQESIESCEICHGSGGPNAKFCKSCHAYEMPHPAEFKQFHSKTGAKNPKSCQRCHTFKEICSNCHHIGASFTKPWINVHGVSVAKNGTTTCLEKCHQRDFCVKCHQAKKVVPASHKARTFVRNPTATKAIHTQLYAKDSSQCTLCHKGDPQTLPNSAFCKGCHRLEMPHPAGFGPPQGEKPTKDNGGTHASGLKKGTYKKAQCANCHDTAFCNSCHHQGSNPKVPWLKQHPALVKKNGAQPCFDCHVETFCSYCHVRLNK